MSIRITVQPGLTANGEPTTDPTKTIPYANISFEDSWDYVVQVFGFEPIFNLPPVAIPDSFIAERNEELAIVIDDLLSNDYPPKLGNTLTLGGFTQPEHGTVIDSGNGTITYLPANNYFGFDSFEYIANNEVASSTGKININVVWTFTLIESGVDIIALDNSNTSGLSAEFISSNTETVTFDSDKRFVIGQDNLQVILEI